MNVVFLSPNFPDIYWQFCASLKRDGATVLGMGDVPQSALEPQLAGALSDYYYTPDLHNYEDVYRGVAYFSYKHGRVNWLESNNEFWLSTDARLREDFNINTGAKTQQMARWRSKADMKALYAAAGVPTARQIRVTSREAGFAFAREVGYPLFAKPEVGMGAGGAFKIANDDELNTFFYFGVREPYVLEEFVPASAICAYDAILDSHGNPLFQNMEEFPPSMSDLVRSRGDLAYWCRPDVDPRLAQLGQATARGFGITSRFVHMEFFRLATEKPGLGHAGDYVGLEVNCRPTGGNTPDMMNYAHSTNVFQIWADMVCFDESHVTPGAESFWAVYASRRNEHRYRHTHEQILDEWGPRIVSHGAISPDLADDMGDYQYTARLRTESEKDAFVAFVQERA